MKEIGPIFSALMRNKTGVALIVLQVAITLAVVCNSVFIILERAERVGKPSGMDEANTFLIGSLGFTRDYDLTGSIRQDLDLIRSLPGVVGATTTNSVPMSWGGWGTGVDTQPMDPSGERRAKGTAVYMGDEQALDAFGVKLVAGRAFTPEDVVDQTQEGGFTAKSIIVTEPLAKALFPEGSAVGKQVYGFANDNGLVTIVGVVEHMQKPWPTSRDVDFSTLVPLRDADGSSARYLVRTEPGQRDAIMKQVEEKLLAANPSRIVRDARTIESIRVEAYRGDRAMMTILISVMAALLLVTGAGIVGLASFWVTRRIKQIGTRRALGARRFNIRSYFQTENGLMVGMGVVLGVLLTYGFNIWLMQNYDAERLPWFYLPIGALAVFGLGQLAVFGPARRASQVSPAVATRTA
ncbi:MAG TPA: FtsX-like permease family protein [Candidatus Saccharimonadia bacterium]|nr:FtsX-like permease family protein [Candidatus Saccharimonadia bacterium]